jgi:hypothetical protein
LSNFNWADKESIRWFILLPNGHEGPYSFNQLLNKNIHPQTKIWAEGLSGPLTFTKAKDALVLAEMPQIPDGELETTTIEELPPPIPELEQEKKTGKTQEIETFNWKRQVTVVFSFFILFLGYQLFQSQKVFKIDRSSKMSPKLQKKIQEEMSFKGWDKKIFFKEFVASDLSTIWFVTESFQECRVEASFSSVKDKLLTIKPEKISFKSEGDLKKHLVEFKKYSFTEGNRILPGMYDVFIRADNCKWNSWTSKLGNFFSSPDDEYVANFKVILYPNGPLAFHEALTKLLKKQLDEKMKVEHYEQMFWEDLQQKLQTILAISLQVEQSFYDFLALDARKFSLNLPRFISGYTKKYGHFLTNFVSTNEEYFKSLSKTPSLDIGSKRKYEPMIRLTAKLVGFESMKVIEDFQKLKSPKRDLLNSKKIQIKKVFENIKADINKKIIKISEERSAIN